MRFIIFEYHRFSALFLALPLARVYMNDEAEARDVRHSRGDPRRGGNQVYPHVSVASIASEPAPCNYWH